MTPSQIPPDIAEAVSRLKPVNPQPETADFLNVSTRTLKRWTAAGRIRGTRTGKKVQYTRLAIAEFMMQGA